MKPDLPFSALWRSSPKVVRYNYWVQKKQFLLAVDSYRLWVAFAVEAGSFHYRIREHEGLAQFGDIVICPPETEFHRTTEEPVTFHFFMFNWHNVQLDDTGTTPSPAGKITVKDTSRLSLCYRSLRQLGSSVTEYAYHLRSHYFNDLWQQFCFEHWHQEQSKETEKRDSKMVQAAQWIEEQAFGAASLKQLAAQLKLSPPMFTYRFQKQFGRTPSAYLRALRLARAKSLLSETDLTLEHIAHQCGYENGFYLSRVFTAEMKISPSAYRRTHWV